MYFIFQNNVLPSGDKFVDGNSVVIQEVSRHHSGIYICSADNEVGNPARAEIDLSEILAQKKRELNDGRFNIDGWDKKGKSFVRFGKALAEAMLEVQKN